MEKINATSSMTIEFKSTDNVIQIFQDQEIQIYHIRKNGADMLQISRDQNTLKLIKSAYFSSKNKLMWTLLHTKSDGGKDYRLVVTEIN